jgi:hypothetical protein
MQLIMVMGISSNSTGVYVAILTMQMANHSRSSEKD